MTTRAAPGTIACIFCGAVEEPGERGEDIVSDWYAREAGGPGKYTQEVAERTAEASRSSTRHSQTIAAFRLKDVCRARCNNGWMAMLEKRAKPILLPMIRGQVTELSDSDARIISAWAQVKAVTLDASYAVAHLPADVPRAMVGSSLPLSRMGVTLAASEEDPGVHVKVARRNGELRMADLDGGRVKTEVARFTFVFGQLVVQACWVLEGGVPVEVLLGLGNESWLPIWPPHVREGAMSWPPAVALTPRTLPSFC